MRRAGRVRRWCLLGLLGLAAAIALVPWRGLLWDGAFTNVECRLRFLDGDDKPVPGVTLTVLTKGGTVCHCYPIDEFVPDQPVTSDSGGWMVIHHSSAGLEFAGQMYSNLVGMHFGETSSPAYECVFTHDGREVFRTPYNFHRAAWAEFGKEGVTRQWSPPWYNAKPGTDLYKHYESLRRRQFGGKWDNLDREERTAAANFQRRYFDAKEPSETRFGVVERTIVIPSR